MTVRVLPADPVESTATFDVYVFGPLNWSTGNDFAAAGIQLLTAACGPLNVRIDLGGVTDVDLAGLRSVQSVAASIIAQAGVVSLHRTSLDIFRLLEHIDWNGDWLDPRPHRNAIAGA